MSSRQRLLYKLIFPSLLILLIGTIIFDIFPQIRGPMPETAEWHWPYQLRPMERWWPGVVIVGVMTALGVVWLPMRKRSFDLGVVAVLFCLHLCLQLGIMYADTSDWRAEPINRTLAISSNGYFQPAVDAHAAFLPEILAAYPEQMLDFESEHMRTHPPGLMILNWSFLSGFEQLPMIADRLAQRVWPYRCTDVWLLNQPAFVAAALFGAAWFPMVIAAAAVFPAYGLGRRWLSEKGARAAVLLIVGLPALSVFAPGPDQLYATGALLIFYLLDRGMRKERGYGWLAVAGILLGALSFLSLGNGVLAVTVTLFVFGSYHFDIRQSLRVLVPVGLASMIPWVINTAVFGVFPWEIAAVGMDQHYSLVTSLRPYRLWLVWNWVDFAVLGGAAAIIGVVVALVAIFLGRKVRILDNPAVRLAAALMVTMLLIALSGSTRGEVGRLWLVFMGLWVLPAAWFVNDYIEGSSRWLAAVVGLQLVLTLSVGLAWQTMQDVIVIAERPAEILQPAVLKPIDVSFGEHIRLTAYEVVQFDRTLELFLQWESSGPADRPYTVFNHLINSQGQLVGQADGWPLDGQWPPTCWQNGEVVVDHYVLPLDTLRNGRYRIFVGMYDGANGERVTVDGDATGVFLQDIEVK